MTNAAVEHVNQLPGEQVDPQMHQELERTWTPAKGVIGWLVDTNQKHIGMRYIVTAMVFFTLAGLLALAMRVQLAFPESRFLSADKYNQFFTTHGTAMMFLFAVPIMEGFGLYLVSLMIGTRNVAFPRMNAFGYYIYLIGGIFLFTMLIINSGPDVGWFAYTPLSGPQYSPGKRADTWAQMITLTEISALVGATITICTAFKQRAPGMTLNRIPIFVWAQVVTGFMIIFAMPAVMLASGMLAMDRLAHVNTHFFNAAEGGDNVLYQHVFWFFGHPEVYIIFIPATGIVSEIIQTFSRRRMFGYPALILSLIATAFIGFGLWVHHMFAEPIPLLGRSFFTGSSMLIAIPSGIQVFCWLSTLLTGKPQLKTPLLFVLGFLVLFALGGLTGIMFAAVSIDQQLTDTFFVVAHFHYVLIGGAVFPLFAAFYYWFPKWTGRMLSEKMGIWNFILLFVGFNLTFFPMHILGMAGMTRRIYTYIPQTGWGSMNFVATVGAFIIGLSVLLFVINVIVSRKSGEIAGPNPWGAPTLEWSTTSPPPSYNFLYVPTVAGRAGLWDDTKDTPVVVGLSHKTREVLTTTILDARPDHRYELAIDSIWPLFLAIVAGGSFIVAIFTPWGIPVGAALSFIVLILWFWRGNEPKSLVEGIKATPGAPPATTQLTLPTPNVISRPLPGTT
jgi:cytochrome c oxidase subunit I+III